jgi:hypothetical protein
VICRIAHQMSDILWLVTPDSWNAITCNDATLALQTRNLVRLSITELQSHPVSGAVLWNENGSEFFQCIFDCLDLTLLRTPDDIFEPLDDEKVHPRSSGK